MISIKINGEKEAFDFNSIEGMIEYFEDNYLEEIYIKEVEIHNEDETTSLYSQKEMKELAEKINRKIRYKVEVMKEDGKFDNDGNYTSKTKSELYLC